MSIIVHVTHEAVQKVGGIGAVLQGLITAKKYGEHINRTILIGPVFPAGVGEERLGGDGEVLYSSSDGIDKGNYAEIFKPIEEKYYTWIVYGKRRFFDRASGIETFPEVILVEPSNVNQNRENYFKASLYHRFGIQSHLYENEWEYEQYVRIAEPGYEAIRALIAENGDEPCFIIAHEFMGIPLALKAILEDEPNVKTIFYAHEVATIRPLVEDTHGHDTSFYNVLELAASQGKFVEGIYGFQNHFFKHALVTKAKFCDNIFAVGDLVIKEFRFLGADYKDINIDLVYNGVPAFEITLEDKKLSRARLQKYASNLLGYIPDYVCSHVTRLVPSKALWRDIRVLEHLDKMLATAGQTCVLFVLSTLIGTGRPDADIRRMEAEYGWPLTHKEGYPDLVGLEVNFYDAVEAFNSSSKAAKIVFVNQFGWSQDKCGVAMPEDMEFMDIRKGTDVEFGQSVYEPFGIAQVEPLSFGALCVVSNVCGCCGFVEKVTGGGFVRNVIIADYTKLASGEKSIDEVLSIGIPQRDVIESHNSYEAAVKIFDRLPRTDEEITQMISDGYAIGSKMSWEVVVSDYFLPGLEKALG